MATFTAQVSHNQYLASGADAVEAVVSVSATRDGSPLGPRPLAEALLIDCSGSMQGANLANAKAAVATAIDLLTPDAAFCVIAGSEVAKVTVALTRATPQARQQAKAAVEQLRADGGTAMSTWLNLAREQLAQAPNAICHALLLTDGRNESESDKRLDQVLQECEGVFQCDARGIGTNWVPSQLRRITTKLLGTLDIIPRPEEIAADFRKVIEAALGKAVADVALRVWTPQQARVARCQQVFPQQLDLTHRAQPNPKSPQVRDYPTGAWGDEKRDYHLRIEGISGKVGQRMCAARVSLVMPGQDAKLAEAMILAQWTEDEAASAVINPSVAHYTGQAELAQAIQGGLQARSAGDVGKAELLFGRAVQIAAATNPDTMKLLRKVVQIEDERQGTVRLLKNVKKEDEFALDTRSTRSARVAKDE